MTSNGEKGRLVELTTAASDFVAGLRFPELPAECVRIVCNGYTDCMAVSLLGLSEAPSRSVIASLATRGEGRSRICLSANRASPQEAALASGVAAHSLDYDDTGIGAHPAHPSAVLVSAILAAGESIESSGEDAIAAYVAGYEVWGDLARRDGRPHNVAGWHPSGVFGAVAAAAAVANLFKLDPAVTRHALGISASLAGGLIANFGSAAKPLHVGRAAQSGVLAATLAKCGMTAAPDALEGSGGFLRSYSSTGRPDLVSPPIYGHKWWIEEHGLNLKLYPVCYSIHRALDGLLEALEQRPIDPTEISEIHVELTESQLSNLVQHEPSNGHEAKFSAEFAISAALLVRRLGFEELNDEFVRRRDVRQLMERVRLREIPAASRQSGDRVILGFRDGTRIEIALRDPRGHARRPPESSTLYRKFVDCIRASRARVDVDRMFEQLQNLERVSSVEHLTSADIMLDDLG